jgi:hypothetical protein
MWLYTGRSREIAHEQILTRDAAPQVFFGTLLKMLACFARGFRKKRMNARQSPAPAPGPDLLARYLNAYLQARQMSDVERPWGLGDDGLDALWSRLTGALSGGDAVRLNTIVATELNDVERSRIIESIVPLIFALPLRDYPAELRAMSSGPRLVLTLHHPGHHSAKGDCPENIDDAPALQAEKLAQEKEKKKKIRPKDIVEIVGYLPSALTPAFAQYLKRVLRWNDDEKHVCVKTISSGGRRRRVRVTLLARSRGVKIRFLERVHSPMDE